MFTLGLKCFRHHQVAAAVSTVLSTSCCVVQAPKTGLSGLCRRGYATVKQLVYPQAHSVYMPKRHFVFVTNREHVLSLVFKSRTLNIATRHMAQKTINQKNTSALIYIIATGIFMCGMGYAAVPLYRMFCQATGLGGQATKGHDTDKVETMKPVKDRQITVRFNADTESRMQWKFMPHQPEVKLVPGETALAFYSAKNPTDRPIIGISTYNVVPFDAGQYFNKIQCFCFEEQRLNPHEEVDMPVFFYIDPDFNEDPKMERVHTITLSYTFFEATEGMTLPLPGYITPQPQPVT